MATLLRGASTALAAALLNNTAKASADLHQFTLVDGSTVLRFTSWDSDLISSSLLYSSRSPWIKRSRWNVVNTMEIPTMDIDLLALNTSFAGGAQIKTQIHNGLFDGSRYLLQRVFMPTPGDTTTLGVINVFGGVTAGIDLIGSKATITVKGKNNMLDQQSPRNLYQKPCNHAFCDPGCTLNRATFTASYTVGTAPTKTFVAWPGAAPGNYAAYQGGTVAITSGAATGSRRSIVAVTTAGLFLAYPLYALPSVGDSFTAFQGCDKSYNSGSNQSCTSYSNTQHYRGFEFVPPPNSAY